MASAREEPATVRIPAEARGLSLSGRSLQVSPAAGWLTGKRVVGTRFWLRRFRLSFVRRGPRRGVGRLRRRGKAELSCWSTPRLGLFSLRLLGSFGALGAAQLHSRRRIRQAVEARG